MIYLKQEFSKDNIMVQKTIREWNNNQYSATEVAELIKELDDRTKSSQAGYNSIDELASKVKVVEQGGSGVNVDSAYEVAVANPNIHIVNDVSDITGDQSANAGKIWELQADIDCAGAVIDLSAYNITLKDGGGKLTNFTSINLGDFSTDGNPNAVYFDQSGTITGESLDKIVHLEWFGLNKNAHLLSGATINGALPDHIAIQNSMAVLPVDGATWAFPHNAKMMQGDGTNPDYTYNDTPYTGNGNVRPDLGQPSSIGVLQGFEFFGYTNLTILGNGSTIIANPNQTNITSNKGFDFRDCDNLSIYNLKYDGNVLYRDPYLIDYNPYHIQHGFGIYSSDNFILENIESNNCVMDGFYIGKRSGGKVGQGGVMRDCKALYNYRQGMSVVSYDFCKVYNSHFSFTGRTISLVDGRILGTSPYAGVDMEGRHQDSWLFEGCTIEGNRGAGLAPHWGTFNSTVRNTTFIDDSLFEPQDVDPEVNGNNSYLNNTFINSTVDLNAGGSTFSGNIFKINNEIIAYNVDGSVGVISSPIILKMQDVRNYYAAGTVRKSIVSNNFIYVDAMSANFLDEADPAFTGVSMARILIDLEDVVFEDNEIINQISINDVGGDGSATIINLTGKGSRINNNRWLIQPDVRTKYPNNIGRMSFGYYPSSFDKNEININYGSISTFDIQSNMPKPDIRGSIVRFSSLGGTIDGDEAFKIHVPNVNGLVKISVPNSTSQGSGFAETWLDTSNPSYRNSPIAIGASESGWYFSDPKLSTNPKSGNASFMIAARHDTSGNSNLETSIVVEWFGQNGDTFSEEQFFIERADFAQTASDATFTGTETDWTVTGIPAAGYQLLVNNSLQVLTTDYTLTGSTFSFVTPPGANDVVMYIPTDEQFRKVYTGGKSGTTAQRPTTGGLDNYTEIKFGAVYDNNETSQKQYYNGTSWIAY
ncbi:hypothetical protein [Changchengzhania lutea]|uniref:hypothetical protein n=1 Tax=Changchengzhania lutea TaxID=2049305 RepID=UPI00115E7361|nr:hypothetical protein [Changchengzhania lutea]